MMMKSTNDEDTADVLPHTVRASSLRMRPSKDLTGILPTKEVRVAYQVLSISNIDDDQNRFTVDFIVYYSWYDDNFRAKMDNSKTAKSIDWKVWQPHPMFFDNDLETTTIFSHLTVDMDEKSGPKLVTLIERYRGTFYQRLHLAHFPFDGHTLTVNIGSKLPAHELRYVEDPLRRSGIKKEFSMAEWHLLNSKSTFTSAHSVASNNRYPLMKLHLSVRRRSGYYVYNTAVTVSMMVVLSWSSFFVQAKELGDRMAITLTLVLTTVAWKYVVSDKLPKIAYLTLFDWYIVAAFFFIFMTGIENIIVTLVDNDQAATVDLYVGIAIVSLWLLWHTLFCLHVWRARAKVRETLSRESVSHEVLEVVCDGGLCEEILDKNN